jgi:hypothetical protein
VPFFPLRARDAIPVVDGSGNSAGRVARSLASAAVQTAGDAMARWYVNYSGSDIGLRGGSWSDSTHGETTTFTLDSLKWTPDLAVSGTLAWNQLTGPCRQICNSRLTMAAPAAFRQLGTTMKARSRPS